MCELSKEHQVIYTTHSDKMVDIFDTKGLIRLELNEKNETIKKYNNVNNIDPKTGEVVTLEEYNTFIRTIEPNLNKILFSKKVILVEGPNDLMVYNFVIKKKIWEKIKNNDEIKNKELYAETYLNFHNIAIIPHHGKSTALYLIKICKYFVLDYFVINDWDFEINFIDKINLNFDDLKKDKIWEKISQEKNKKGENYAEKTLKSMITTNKNLVETAGKEKIHFNIPKLEKVIGYDFDDKNSFKIWNLLNNNFTFDENLFPQNLKDFLEIKSEETKSEIKPENLPF